MKKSLILMVFCFGIYCAKAQSDAVLKNLEKQASKSSRLKLNSPFGAGSLSNIISNVSLSSFLKEGVNGKVELQANFLRRWSGGLTVDQKIGKNDNEATPLDLTGISPGTTVKFNLQKMCWHPKFDKFSDQEAIILHRASNAYEKRNNKNANIIGLKELFDKGNEEEKKLAIDAFNAVNHNPAFLNFEFGFTKTSFNYATDSFKLTEIKDAYITPTVKFSLVKVFGNDFGVTGYLALSYNFNESYNAADDVTFSIPFGATNNYSQSTIAFGKPEKKTNHNIIAEYRKNIITENNHTIAVSPSATFGINSNKLSLFLPVYFIKGTDEKGKLLSGLQGGVRFGYTTSTESGKVSSFRNGFIAQLIISQPLDFLEKL